MLVPHPVGTQMTYFSSCYGFKSCFHPVPSGFLFGNVQSTQTFSTRYGYFSTKLIPLKRCIIHILLKSMNILTMMVIFSTSWYSRGGVTPLKHLCEISTYPMCILLKVSPIASWRTDSSFSSTFSIKTQNIVQKLFPFHALVVMLFHCIHTQSQSVPSLRTRTEHICSYLCLGVFSLTMMTACSPWLCNICWSSAQVWRTWESGTCPDVGGKNGTSRLSLVLGEMCILPGIWESLYCCYYKEDGPSPQALDVFILFLLL